MPVYDEYEEEYPWVVLEKLAIELGPTDGENQDAIRSQEDKADKGDKGIEGDILPLCYASFELIRHIIKACKQKQKEGEMVPSRDLYRKEDGKKK